MVRFIGIIFFLSIGLAYLSADETFLIYSEAGWYNKAYQDQRYVSQASVTFPVGYWALSGEIRDETPEGHVFGGGLAQTVIQEGQIWNVDRWEQQPFTILSMPYVFVGQDWGWIDVECGLGWYFTVQTFPSDPYITSSGSTETGKPGGLDWDHSESFTTFNFLLRFLPENGFHLKVRFGRQELSLTENLFNFEAVLPTAPFRWSTYVSMETPQDFFFHNSENLRSNQRWGIGLSYLTGVFEWGLVSSVLIVTEHGGMGEVGLGNRFALGLRVSFRTGN